MNPMNPLAYYSIIMYILAALACGFWFYTWVKYRTEKNRRLYDILENKGAPLWLIFTTTVAVYSFYGYTFIFALFAILGWWK